MVTVTTKPLQGGNEEGLASVDTSPTKQGLHINGLKRDRRLSENLANGRRKHDDSNVIQGNPEADASLETWLAAQQRMMQGVTEAATERVSKMSTFTRTGQLTAPYPGVRVTVNSLLLFC
jgi:hypothetical protein